MLLGPLDSFAVMALSTGQTLSFYEILGPLGAGGMGEVYRALDSRLEREVAIKVLPEELADDEERLRRFEREAKTLASLNHSNVAGIHGVDQVGDVCFLALELVPGEDLAARISRGAMPVDEALDVCRQIAEGLEAAHEAGVVHRDLKPANIRVTPDGVVKILDFGLAKPIHPKANKDGTTSAESDSFLMTEEGLVLGTPTYMSPEQARGKPVDRRTDIWAFGCVLFECLTGERAFGGESLTDILASIVGGEPDWSRVPPLPERVSELLRRTLARDPRARLRDIGEARIALELGATEPIGARAGAEQPGASSRGPSAVLVVALAVLALAIGFGAGWGAKTTPILAESPHSDLGVYAEVHAFADGESVEHLRISGDGQSISWANNDGIWVRRLDQLEPVLIHAQKVEGYAWSPDGQEIVFHEGDALWRISASGGYPERIPGGDVGAWSVLSWNEDERLLIGTPEGASSLPADGGELEGLVELVDPPMGSHWHFLHLLPDGGVLGALHDFASEFTKVEVFRGGSREVVYESSRGEFKEIALSPRGNLLFSAKLDGKTDLWSIPLSLEKLQPIGEPRLIKNDAGVPSVSRTGALAYLQREGASGKRQLAWLSLGEEDMVFLGEPYESLRNPKLSPDGMRITFSTGSYTNSTYKVFDLDRGVSTPLVEHQGLSMGSMWLDDEHIVIARPQDPAGSFVFALSGRGEPKLLTTKLLQALSPDGDYSVYLDLGDLMDGMEVFMEGPDGTRLDYLEPDDGFMGFSPDGRWMLYGSERSGSWQLYLSQFPPAEGDWSVDVTKADGAWFKGDMSAIYYYTEVYEPQIERKLYRVDLSVEPDVKLGAPEVLLELESGLNVSDYDAASDRFLVLTGASTSGASQAFVHTKWE